MSSIDNKNPPQKNASLLDILKRDYNNIQWEYFNLERLMTSSTNGPHGNWYPNYLSIQEYKQTTEDQKNKDPTYLGGGKQDAVI